MIVVVVPRQALEKGFQREWPEVLIPTGLCLVLLSYYIVLEWRYGTTPGKGIMGIQVRGRDDSPCSFRASLIRNYMRIVDAFAGYLVGLLVALVSQSRQRFGDLLAGTIVVRRPVTAVVRVLLAVIWIALAGGGFVACFVVHR